jgi:hypothetical protein
MEKVNMCERTPFNLECLEDRARKYERLSVGVEADFDVVKFTIVDHVIEVIPIGTDNPGYEEFSENDKDNGSDPDILVRFFYENELYAQVLLIETKGAAKVELLKKSIMWGDYELNLDTEREEVA